MPPVKALEFLRHPAKYPARGVCAVFGKDTFFKSNVIRCLCEQVLSDDDAEFSLMRFDGALKKNDDKAGENKNRPRDPLQELLTAAMFGGRKFVLIDNADKYAAGNRAKLETYAEAAAQKDAGKYAVLVLQLENFVSNSPLYKILNSSGLLVDCAGLAEKEIPPWICSWSQHRYNIRCEADAADLLLQRVGSEHALLDQELAKLSVTADAKRGITVQEVETLVGSWRTRTVFDMLEFALKSQPSEAVRLLDALILAGENAVSVYTAIAPTLRKLASATQYILDAEQQGSPVSIRSALEKAGFKSYLLNKAESQLKYLGRHRGRRMLHWLIKLDLDLKGGSRIDPRQMLETFIIKIASRDLAKAEQ
ncbi:MAG: DNA polymerase III subunit delta [Planctomycetaceae bacterium]|jgi:DNA polymerase-3 subunit delta|nr:DNA polymerase III subunit delta [Planctomycetaceae bacterium]